jgi:hypothetical protein
LSKVLKNSSRFLVVAIIVIFGTASCAASPAHLSGAEYLQSLKSSHRLDSKAAAICTRDAGTPSTKPLVAANSTLKFVRKLEAPGYVQRERLVDLEGKKEGYAAICLMKFVSKGETERIWAYYLPDRASGPINAG